MIQRRVFGGDGCIGVAFFCFAVALVVGGGVVSYMLAIGWRGLCERKV